MRHAHVGEPIRDADLPAQEVVDGVSGCVMLVTREVFDRIGLLHEDYFFSFEDLDFCLAARRAGFATVVSALARVYHAGGQSIGPASARRLYFAARNHLLLTKRASPEFKGVASACRSCSVVALNVAHAVVSPGGSMPARLAAVARGTRDYIAGRFGMDSGAD
jgi:GT2 family glycosyltransferase